MIFCHRGATHAPPDGLRPGDVVKDPTGREWAYTGDSRDDRGGAIFVVQAQLPRCQPVPPAPSVQATRIRGNETVECRETTYHYSPGLKIVRHDYPEGKKKDFQPKFLHNGEWHSGSGPETWPFYGIVDQANKAYVLEVEGEKCVDVLRAAGIAAITHPGHQRSETPCRARYAGLSNAGIKKVYYIADNDSPGRKHAASFQKAAQSEGIEMLIIPAEEIYPDLPESGSVDDMPPDSLASLVLAAIRTSAGMRPAPLNRTSYSAVKNALADLEHSSTLASADIQTCIADIASEHKAAVFDVRRIWDSLVEDRLVADEALSARTSILQRQELESRRKSIRLIDYLPESICSSVETITQNFSCDALMAAAIVLTTAAGALRAGHRIDVGDGVFVKQPVVWLLICGASGDGKSPPMTHLSERRFWRVIDYYNQLSTEAEREYDFRYGSVPKRDRPDKPEPLRTLVSNVTTEALTGIVTDNHSKGLPTFFYSEEAVEIIGNFDQYKAGKGRGKEQFLGLYDGKLAASHRVGRRSKMITGLVQNAFLGAIQPGVLRLVMEEGDSSGLFARFLPCPVPAGIYKKPNFSRTPSELMVVNMAERCLDDFYYQCLNVRPLALRLDADAIDLFTILHKDTWEKTQALYLESQRAVLGKRLGYILQLALVIHLCDVATGGTSDEELYVSKQTLARAAIMVDILQCYAIVEQQESQMRRHGAFDMPRKIHSHALNANGCTASQFITACVPASMRSRITPAQVGAAMDQLTEAGLGEWQKKGRSRIFVASGRYPD